MALFSSTPRKHGGALLPRTRRNTTSVLTILLLVLSHNVWNTLQCVPSSSQQKLRQIMNSASEEQDVEEDGDFENNRASSFSSPFSNDNLFEGGNTNNNNGEGTDNSGFEKKGGQGQRQLSQSTEDQNMQLCSFRLMDAIFDYCGANNFYEPANARQVNRASSLSQILRIPQKRTAREVAIQRRLTRSLANDCCKKPCNASTFRMFCKDRSRIPVKSTNTQVESNTVVLVPEPVTDENEAVDNVIPPSPPEQPHQAPTQLVPTSPPEDPEPVIYNSIFHLINFLHRQFGQKSSPRGGTAEEDKEGGSGTTLKNNKERELPLPQARIQPQTHHHHHPNSQFPNNQHHSPKQQRQQQQRQMEVANSGEYPNYRPTEYQRYQGNPFQAPAEDETVAGGNMNRGAARASFNTNTASSNRHASQHRNTATNTGGATNSFDHRANNHLHYPIIQNHLHHNQGRPGRQQHSRKVSSNVRTSTIAPDVTIIRLESPTDDDAPYRKRK